jgi:hypothetical protein
VLIISATISYMILCGMVLYGVQLGFGKHIWNIAPYNVIIQQVKQVIKVLFVCQIFYATSISLAKLSIVALYIRVFPNPLFHKIILATSALIIAMWVCSIFVTIFQCNPIDGAWDFEIKDAKCITYVDYQFVSGIINAITDIILCVSPLPMVIKVQISRREKYMVCGLFGLGFLYVPLIPNRALSNPLSFLVPAQHL